ncbi:MAG TPA: aspartate dehydrogenase [Candidatus Hydrogenedentes bacterium]|nr:aspartate dehydrogenase [Candidatus Hydrogenedentota bacterium]HPG65802.1 aspartate dehydrogenase [Candidatus Hydrogenedentota bacterium]
MGDTSTPIKMKVGLVGCGNIGADLCIALQKGDIPAEIVALTDIDENRAKVLQRTFQLNALIETLDETAAVADFVIECAEAAAVADVIHAAIRHRKACLIMSVGGLLAQPELLEQASASGVHVQLPSGAICGLDGIRSAMQAGLHRVTLTTRKPPAGLAGAPYLAEKGIDVQHIREPMVVFEGTALDAVKAFPKNVNVAATLSLVGIGPHETRVRVIADPNATVNSHEVIAEGAFGRLQTITENLPSPRNAKSSYLASLSACAELRAAAAAFVSRV